MDDCRQVLFDVCAVTLWLSSGVIFSTFVDTNL